MKYNRLIASHGTIQNFEYFNDDLIGTGVGTANIYAHWFATANNENYLIKAGKKFGFKMAKKENTNNYYVYTVEILYDDSVAIDAQEFCSNVFNESQIIYIKNILVHKGYIIDNHQIKSFSIEGFCNTLDVETARKILLELGIVVVLNNCYFGRDEGYSNDYIAILTANHELCKINIVDIKEFAIKQ